MHFTYDLNGNLIKKEWHTDTEAESIAFFEYDTNNNRVIEEFDWGADGTIEEISKLKYDTTGNLIRIETDSILLGNNIIDGFIDQVKSFEFDAEGKRTFYKIDFDADTNFDSIWSYKYDADGRRTHEENDADADGNLNYSYILSYEGKALSDLIYDIDD